MEESSTQNSGEMLPSNEESEFNYRDYFISKEAFLIFVLLHTDRENRAELLGIKEDMYESLAKAKKMAK